MRLITHTLVPNGDPHTIDLDQVSEDVTNTIDGARSSKTIVKAIFVFGSNLIGSHGAGAAAFAATHYGAQGGVGTGRTGRAYAIPTKDERIVTLPISRIRPHVAVFLDYAAAHPELEFFVTRVGCGLAGYTDTDIAPLFDGAPDNCYMPPGWR